MNTRKARILDGVVMEVLEEDPFPPFFPDIVWIDCPSTVKEGWLWDGKYFTPPTPPPSVPYSLTLMSESSTQLLTLGGVELANSRRFIDFTNVTQIRVQFKGNISMRVEYSYDLGSTWIELVPVDAYTGNNPYLSNWIPLPEGAMSQTGTLLRAVGVGTGVLTTVNYVEIQYR